MEKVSFLMEMLSCELCERRGGEERAGGLKWCFAYWGAYFAYSYLHNLQAPLSGGIPGCQQPKCPHRHAALHPLSHHTQA